MRTTVFGTVSGSAVDFGCIMPYETYRGGILLYFASPYRLWPDIAFRFFWSFSRYVLVLLSARNSHFCSFGWSSTNEFKWPFCWQETHLLSTIFCTYSAQQQPYLPLRDTGSGNRKEQSLIAGKEQCDALHLLSPRVDRGIAPQQQQQQKQRAKLALPDQVETSQQKKSEEIANKMTSFKRPIESREPRRKTPTKAESQRHGAAEWGDLTAMSEAGSRREVSALPVAYAVPAPAAEMQGLPQPSAPSPGSGSYVR